MGELRHGSNPGGSEIRHGFGLASPALAGIPCAIIGAIALFILHHRETRNTQICARSA